MICAIRVGDVMRPVKSASPAPPRDLFSLEARQQRGLEALQGWMRPSLYGAFERSGS